MPVIRLRTLIDAPRERVFDLARSIEFHQASTEGTGEKAVAGVVNGLIGLGQTVTWEARHLGVRQRLTVKITGWDRPNQFEDRMLAGAFQYMWHVHTFNDLDGKTLMLDRFEFSAPLGILGRMAERLFLIQYMEGFLVRRNALLKRTAESDEWTKYLGKAEMA